MADVIAISLGWGVQSFALAAMSAMGKLPRVDVAIHADTTHERRETYTFAQRWIPWLESRGVRVVTIIADKRAGVIMDSDSPGIMVPAFTSYENGPPSGILRRQCTHDWKIAPIRRWLRANRADELVQMWLGITLDEVGRMKPSDVGYIENVYPFIEMLDRPWTRNMVARWLTNNGLEIPVKSACIFCPFHNRAAWREIKLAGTNDWEKAVTVDEAIRHKRPGYEVFLSSERRPLAEIDFRNEEDRGQLSLWDDAECEGLCFL